ncbi:MAG: hypothetical protein A2X08_01595 [Bacteroidetes bacterium GWA2_32_17]|nr:MAG: hypothetical protein A2X08_01595 [Bacteroidetes bacterium GWA2_32_17]
MQLRLLFFIFLLIIIFKNLYSQNETQYTDTSKTNNYTRILDAEDYNADILNELLRKEINKYRLKQKSDTLTFETILKNAADDQAAFMAQTGNAVYEQGGKKKTTGKRIMLYGGSDNGEELVVKMPIKKGPELFTYGKVVDDIMFKWLSDKKGIIVLNDPKYMFYGIGSTLDDDHKKVYVSAVFGNYSSFNAGSIRKDELSIPFTTKKYGLKKIDDNICSRCNKFRNIDDLQRGLYVKDGNIYFKYDNFKALKKLLKDPSDGIVVDVVQRAQYPCEGENIINNNLVNKGVMLKRYKASKLEKKNLVKEQKNKVEVLIGQLPKGITDNYELNLLLVLEKRVCRTISPSFSEEGGVEYSNLIELLADTVVISESEYVPTTENSTTEFIIPFERNKYDYKPEDIEPLIKKLKEPDFIINKLSIIAYSSIEGNDETNKALQKNRAESIVNALKSRQTKKVAYNITTGDNIEDFKHDVQGTEFANIANMSVSEAQEYISKNNLINKLEPILQKHRYAKIAMNIIYDIGGKKEQAFVLSRFNKSVKENNLIRALAIQKFIFRKVLKKEYDSTAVSEQEIPETPEFAGLLLNKLWLSGLLMNKLWLERYINNEEISEEYCNKISKFHKLAPDNFYITYNWYYCRILHEEFTGDKSIVDFQKEISDLYSTNLQKHTIDLLNMEYQFKVIQYLDTLDEASPLLLASLDSVRIISKLTESNWQNSIKLAYIFVGLKDYDFAARLLEPYILSDNPFDELIFSYIAICSHLPYKFGSPRFILAMNKAKDLDKERYCKLFKKDKLTIQALENTKVKEVYCKTCGK